VKATNGYGKQAQLFRALSHPARLRILDILAQQEACVCHLTAILGQQQPYVSRHLATLREAGLVVDRREGTLIYYRLADEHLVKLLDEGKGLLADMAIEDLVYAPVPHEVLDNCSCPRYQG